MKKVILPITDSVNYIFRLLVWAKYAWVSIFPILAIIGCAWLISGLDEQGIRISGWLLEVLGIGVVAKGLSDSRHLFGLPLVKSLPPFRIRTVNLQGENLISHAYSSAGEVEVEDADSMLVLETRISVLEKNVARNRAYFNELSTRLQVATQTLSEALEVERVNRIKEIGKIQEQLHKAVVGGISLETVGIVWLTCGVTLSSLSEELAKLI